MRHDDLLATKLNIPPIRSELVPRTSLITKLNEGLPHKLSLISAAAGFGKTTVIREWVEELTSAVENDGQGRYKIAWLSLDEGDNDPARFLAYFIAALNQVDGIECPIGQTSLSMIQSPQPPPFETVLTPLINEIATISDRIVIVLDDYHLINSLPIDNALTFLLERLPPQLHLVIATREDPQLPLGRLRASRQLTEVRAADLRFSNSETVHFLNKIRVWLL